MNGSSASDGWNVMARIKGRRSWADRWVRKFFYKYYARNLLYELQLRARADSADYVEAKMADAMMFSDRWELLDYCVASAQPNGLFIECGVGKGDSIRKLARIVPGVIHGFDSFTGLPEDWSGTEARAGKFSTGGVLPKVPGNVRLHPGLFDKSLPEFLRAGGDHVSFLHVDCDLYSATRSIFTQLSARIVPGTIVVFDEYFNYPNWRQHEFRAFQEYVSDVGVTYRYIGFAMREGQVAVRILAKAV
jgi:hypothetical protein